jgi:hypothetical protein
MAPRERQGERVGRRAQGGSYLLSVHNEEHGAMAMMQRLTPRTTHHHGAAARTAAAASVASKQSNRGDTSRGPNGVTRPSSNT